MISIPYRQTLVDNLTRDTAQTIRGRRLALKDLPQARFLQLTAADNISLPVSRLAVSHADVALQMLSTLLKFTRISSREAAETSS
jgi:hypothetical protein